MYSVFASAKITLTMPVNDSIPTVNTATDSTAAVDVVPVDVVPVDTMTRDTVAVPVIKPEKKVEITVSTEPPAWESGLDPIPRPGHVGHNQGIVAPIVLIMLAAALSFQAVKRVLANMVKRLSNNRVREGFETDTGREKRTTLLLIVMTVVFISILATAGLSLAFPWRFAVDMETTTKISAVIGCYFIFQYAVYQTLGYTFTSAEGRILWIRGFTASMTLLGVGLIIPALTVLFYPALAMPAVWVGATLYVIARLMFISRGFRIFYTNIASLIYFILYLCSLEIIPICVIFYVSTQILQY